MSLIQKIIVFLFLVIIIPLVIALATISINSKTISDDVTSGINMLETEVSQSISKAAEQLNDVSSSEIDALTQYNWERLSVNLANQIAAFLYERDDDLTFLAEALSSADIADAQLTVDRFRRQKIKMITTHGDYRYDKDRHQWQKTAPDTVSGGYERIADNEENSRGFRFARQPDRTQSARPIYREISVIDLSGQEMVKSSDWSLSLLNVTDRNNTFARSETYFNVLKTLKPGEIFVSHVIGAYRKTHMIGAYRQDRAAKADHDFAPEESGYAGLENPVGKRFNGIIRYATPLIRDGVKRGYVTMAVDHRHIMEFTDFIVPENYATMDDTNVGSDQATRRSFYTDIKDANKGNYAFMWDSHGRNIAHPREYFISGYDPETGRRVTPWISKDTAEAFSLSGADDIDQWIAEQRHYMNQSRDKKPNIEQVRSGLVPLDCRHLDFAPQCNGWHQINKDGGYGSFQIYWSGIWKLTTIATIPYYTGPYSAGKRGFGYVTIGANIGEFTKSGAAARDALNDSFGAVNQSLLSQLRAMGTAADTALRSFQNQLFLIGAGMIIAVAGFAVLGSYNFRTRIGLLMQKTAEFASGNLDARVKMKGADEIKHIGDAFNVMATTVQNSQQELEAINTNLENLVSQRTDELRQSNQQISDSIDYASRIQRSLLPIDEALKQCLNDYTIIWQPKDVVGGDFYWHKTIGDRDYLVIMDCTGHGVPGAFMTLIATSTLEQIAAATLAGLDRSEFTPDPAEILQNLHEGVCEQLHQVGSGSLSNDGLDAIIMAIPHDKSMMECCGAHIDLFTISPDMDVTRYRGNKTSLGYQNTGEALPLKTIQIPMDQHLTFAITTDGIPTQIGESIRRSYGNKRITEIIAQADDNSPAKISRALLRDFRQWQGKEDRRDDLTLLVFKPD